MVVCPGEKFRALVDEFLRSGLRKGAPPLFTDLSTLYHDSERVTIIEDLTLGYESCLAEQGYFGPQGGCSPAAVWEGRGYCVSRGALICGVRVDGWRTPGYCAIV